MQIFLLLLNLTTIFSFEYFTDDVHYSPKQIADLAAGGFDVTKLETGGEPLERGLDRVSYRSVKTGV